MLKQSIIDKIEKVDYYISGGTCMGRIVACKKPFYRGKGVYHLSTNLADWEIQGEKTMTEEQLKDFIRSIREMKVKQLREAVRLTESLELTLVEDPKWVFRLVEKAH